MITCTSLCFLRNNNRSQPDNNVLSHDKDDTGEEEESQTETKLTGEMRFSYQGDSGNYQESCSLVKLTLTCRSRNDQILRPLSEYGICRTDGEQTIISNP